MSLSPERKESLRNALADSIAGGTEGLIVKDLAAQYVPNKRTRRWWKLKKDYLESSLSDAVDAIVVGVWYGEGKNVGKFSSFLLAVRILCLDACCTRKPHRTP